MSLARTAALAALGLILAVSGCGRDISSGAYRLTQTGAPVEDSCHLLAADGSLPTLHLTKMGDEVRIELELFGAESPVRMLGRFKQSVQGEPDEFSADGSVGEVLIDVDGAACWIEFGQVHVEATVPEGSDGRFDGVLTLRQSLQPDQSGCPQTCRAVVAYHAEKR